ncbi:MAG: hypothetical protein C4534_02785 [Gaiellales bacterium]|nr:MAG: hypothetical protein C4534_02785 [Gaiellales bacterium]
MRAALLEILPLALAASLSPTALGFEITILSGKGNGRRNSLLFVLGAALFLVVLGLLVMLVFRHTVIPSDHHRKLSAWIDIVLGFSIILLVARSFLPRKKKKKSGGSSRRRPYLIVGFLFMAINTSTIIPFVAASKTIADARLPLLGAATLFAALVLMTVWMIAFPVVFSYAAPRSSGRALERMGAFMERHGSQLVRVFFLAAGVYLAVKGISGLWS